MTLTQWIQAFTSDEIEVDDPAPAELPIPLSAPEGAIPRQPDSSDLRLDQTA